MEPAESLVKIAYYSPLPPSRSGIADYSALLVPALRERVDEVVLVTDEEITEATRFLYERAKLACEPAGAASTAALLAGKIDLDPDRAVVAVVSGGNVAPETAVAILASE